MSLPVAEPTARSRSLRVPQGYRAQPGGGRAVEGGGTSALFIQAPGGRPFGQVPVRVQTRARAVDGDGT